jgi:hypothetical protein
MKKQLKALKHYLMGYKLHPKEKMLLYDLWVNIKTVILTLIIFVIMLWLVNASGCLGSRVTHLNEFSE